MPMEHYAVIPPLSDDEFTELVHQFREEHCAKVIDLPGRQEALERERVAAAREAEKHRGTEAAVRAWLADLMAIVAGRSDLPPPAVAVFMALWGLCYRRASTSVYDVTLDHLAALAHLSRRATVTAVELLRKKGLLHKDREPYCNQFHGRYGSVRIYYEIGAPGVDKTSLPGRER